MSNTFDKVLSSTPLNGTAGRVTARGEHWTPEAQMPPGLLHWKSPPPMRAFVENPHGTGVDLTGKVIGRFRVMGLLDAPGGGGARWVCRCSCGDFEARTSRALRLALAEIVNEDERAYRCWFCAQWQGVQERYKKKGSKPLSAFIDAPARVVKLPAKTPEELIAAHIVAITGKEDGAYQAAIKIISTLNKAAFRIVRERHPTPDETETGDAQL